MEKTLACLLPTSCVAIGTEILGIMEQSGKGVRFSTLQDNPSTDDAFSMADVFGMFILDIAIYLILAWYG